MLKPTLYVTPLPMPQAFPLTEPTEAGRAGPLCRPHTSATLSGNKKHLPPSSPAAPTDPPPKEIKPAYARHLKDIPATDEQKRALVACLETLCHRVLEECWQEALEKAEGDSDPASQDT